MRTWTYTLTEHHSEKPWLIVGRRTGITVELLDGQNFFLWAAEQWPSPRYSVELDPFQL